MKVTFVYTDVSIDNSRKFQQAIAQLSSCLKEAGHETSLVHLFEEVDDEDYLVNIVHEHNPDLIAYSFVSGLFPIVKKLAGWIRKNFDTPTICGGPHPTLAPQECIDTGLFDIVCRGEGDRAIVELCNRMENNESINDIPNLWVKTEDHLYKNEIGPLIEDLDSLPSLDYELFNYETLVDATSQKRLAFMASRGCPYNCTYCCNHTFRELYPNKKHYVRFRSVDKVISEIQIGLKKYPFLNKVVFADDTLTLHKDWFEEFAAKYTEKIGLPYQINSRVNHITEEVIQKLKSSGCISMAFGIENGDIRIREEIMRRRTSDEQIIKAFDLCRKYEIKTFAFNIIGVPEETFRTALATIKLNAKAYPDFSYILYFHPFIGTKLNEICNEKKLRNNKTFKTIFEGPTLNLDTITESETVFAFTFFRPLVELYRFYYNLPKPFSWLLDKTTSEILACKLYPKKLSVLLLPCTQKLFKSTKKLAMWPYVIIKKHVFKAKKK